MTRVEVGSKREGFSSFLGRGGELKPAGKVNLVGWRDIVRPGTVPGPLPGSESTSDTFSLSPAHM